MRVLRGRLDDPEADRERTASLVAAAADGTTGLRVWSPPRQVAFGRRDAREDGFERATRRAAERGFRAIERDVGGRAVAYTGRTLAFAHAIPTGKTNGTGVGGSRGGSGRSGDAGDADGGGSIADRYDRATETVLAALRGLDADVAAGEPSASFCPGDHSVRVAGGGKLSGIAQRVRSDAALVAGCIIVGTAESRVIADVTEPVYDALGVDFDPNSVGSVAAAGGPDDVGAVASAIEDAFVDGPWRDGERRVRRVETTDQVGDGATD